LDPSTLNMKAFCPIKTQGKPKPVAQCHISQRTSTINLLPLPPLSN